MKLGIIRVSADLLSQLLKMPEGARIVGIQEARADKRGFWLAPQDSESLDIEIKVEYDGLHHVVREGAVIPLYRYYVENDEGKFDS